MHCAESFWKGNPTKQKSIWVKKKMKKNKKELDKDKILTEYAKQLHVETTLRQLDHNHLSEQCCSNQQ